MAFDWFKRKTQNITTSTKTKKMFPKVFGNSNRKNYRSEELKRNNYVSPEDGFHVRIGSENF
jgi:acetyl-CoA carboxylase carboxyl transferase subunit beta